MAFHYEITSDLNRIGEAADGVKAALVQAGAGGGVIQKVMIITFEATANMALYAGGGTVDVEILPGGVRLCFRDAGRGIEDIKLAASKGYSTADDAMRAMGYGSGMGFYNMYKNAGRLKVLSSAGAGTIIKAEVFYDD